METVTHEGSGPGLAEGLEPSQEKLLERYLMLAGSVPWQAGWVADTLYGKV